jgi:flagellar motor protein MotB
MQLSGLCGAGQRAGASFAGHDLSRARASRLDVTSVRHCRGRSTKLRGAHVAWALEIHAHGADEPIATNDSSDGRRRNRRVDVRIVRGAR